MTDNQYRAIQLVTKANEDQALALLALVSSLNSAPIECIRSHSKGQCKRAIRLLRMAQNAVSDPVIIEDAIAIIRRELRCRNLTV